MFDHSVPLQDLVEASKAEETTFPFPISDQKDGKVVWFSMN